MVAAAALALGDALTRRSVASRSVILLGWSMSVSANRVYSRSRSGLNGERERERGEKETCVYVRAYRCTCSHSFVLHHLVLNAMHLSLNYARRETLVHSESPFNSSFSSLLLDVSPCLLRPVDAAIVVVMHKAAAMRRVRVECIVATDVGFFRIHFRTFSIETHSRT